MKSPVRLAVACALGFLGVGCAGAQPALPPDTATARRTLALFEVELSVIEQLLAAGMRHQAGNYAIRHVDVVRVREGDVRADMIVRVAGRAIVQVSPDSGHPLPPGYREIDGRGRYLIAGLVDMHVHQLTSAAQHILHVGHGVTTVRDMAGFPWLLEWRERSARDAWLAPTMHVASPILASVPMGRFAQVVTTEGAAREAVRTFRDNGYDFIKVHNVLTRPLFEAVTSEARHLGIPVVGHVPHRISVADAVRAGMSTIEHLKGYVDDRTLRIAEDDWLSPTRRGTVWNTPTLYARRLFLTPDEARAWAGTEEARYVPAIERARWVREAAMPPPHALALHDQHLIVLRRLKPVTSRFLAGTDAGGGYPFMVSGAGLHTELQLLHDAGLSTLEALRAATLYPAQALGEEHRIGDVAPGRRADLLLLDANPLASLDALQGRAGVGLRGRWLDRAALTSLLDQLAAANAREPQVGSDGALPDSAWMRETARRIRSVEEAGYVFPAHHIDDFNRALSAFGLPGVVARTAQALPVPDPWTR